MTYTVLCGLLALCALALVILAARLKKAKDALARTDSLASDEIRDAMLFSLTEATALANEMTATMTTTREALAEDAKIALALETAKVKAEAIAERLRQIVPKS